jgi:subtilisin family serine protease/subtilisin-like proprotein convertase family protein
MRTIIMLALILSFTACVQDEGKVSSDSVSGDEGSTTGSTSGGTSGGTTGGSSGTPTDPLYGYQWHLKNTGQDVGSYVDLGSGIDSTPTSGIDLNVESVHDDGILGAGIKIAVSDSGVDYNHSDLDGNDLPLEQRNYSFVDPTRWRNSDAYPSGNEGHGTSVAGIIAAEGWNNIGGRGVAPSANYGAFKFILTYAESAHMASYTDKIIDQMDGDFDVFNYSYGTTQCVFYNNYDDVIDAQKAGVADLRNSLGANYVQSSGNSFIEVDDGICNASPTIFYGNTNATAALSTPYKIVTAAVSADGVKSSYSTPGSGVWVSGLGGEAEFDIDPDPTDAVYDYQYFPGIFTTDIGDCSSGFSYRDIAYQIQNAFNYGFDRDLNPTCDYTNVMNGTSSAAPMVSGVVALMLEKNPDLTWRDVKYILATTAKQIDYDPILNELPHPDPFGLTSFGAYVYDYKWVQNNSPGQHWFSNWYGFGLVDAEAAVALADGWSNLGPYVRTEDSSGVWNHTDSTVTPIVEDATMATSTDLTIAGVQSLTIEAVQVRLTTDHPDPGQLAIHLVSPQGTESRLILAQSNIIADGSGTYYFLTNAFLDEDSGFGGGTWTLKIYDSVADGSGGNVTEWGVNIHGR